MSSAPVNLTVIVGSNRSGRFAPVVSEWFVRQAAQHEGVAAEVVDLGAVSLPAQLGSRSGPGTEELAGITGKFAAADAFVVVTPEYNHSYPAVLKTVIDWHHAEWKAKPVGFVSYGGVSGGLRAVEHLRQVFAELHAVTVRDTVSFHGAWARFGEDGSPTEPDGCNAAARTMLDELCWWSNALTAARRHTPYRF
ncbi:NADPH-dependent FMN reductase [Frankia sp. EI5c]|uniref:NADPH-dependent FMN reductase n=2 Tax=Frankia sp. EI5c TaxID=683316 RepID=UPI000826CAFB|nr:NAD(P)H-dependent oxidoreductase [Frankia sp. EI5c]